VSAVVNMHILATCLVGASLTLLTDNRFDLKFNFDVMIVLHLFTDFQRNWFLIVRV